MTRPSRREPETGRGRRGFLRGMGFGQLRVRHHGDIARIEITPEEFATAHEAGRPDTNRRRA